MIKDFIAGFTEKSIDGIKKVGRQYFLVSKELEEFDRKNDIEAFSKGVFLGAEKRGSFFPSLALLELLSDISERKIFIGERAEWLFLCGRDLMATSIKKANADKGLVLVQSVDDENLGYGRTIGDLNAKKDMIVVKNLLDRGDFLRREMDK